jgi:hypothetical protein
MSTATRSADTIDGTVTSWIPLTTANPLPVECLTEFISYLSASDLGGQLTGLIFVPHDAELM